ncbi:MAG: hypothetical protein OI715_00705 (plasmid) [Candidatus Methanoperedens sp.]|nr:MAG: hypothetical protein OI715_00705 [Candidatus Methanoperedens sp.]
MLKSKKEDTVDHFTPPEAHLIQIECETCGRYFYVKEGDKSNLDIEFGCPFGCDCAGKPVRKIIFETKSITDLRTGETTTHENISSTDEPIAKYTLGWEDVKTFCEKRGIDFSRLSENKRSDIEHYAQKGLESQIDWEVVIDCALQALKGDLPLMPILKVKINVQKYAEWSKGDTDEESYNNFIKLLQNSGNKEIQKLYPTVYDLSSMTWRLPHLIFLEGFDEAHKLIPVENVDEIDPSGEDARVIAIEWIDDNET